MQTQADFDLAAAAQAVLEVWNDEGNRETDIIGALESPMAKLCTALVAAMGG